MLKYCIYCASAPSLHRESTDSLICIKRILDLQEDKQLFYVATQIDDLLNDICRHDRKQTTMTLQLPGDTGVLLVSGRVVHCLGRYCPPLGPAGIVNRDYIRCFAKSK